MLAVDKQIHKPGLSDTKSGIIRTLLYFDIFDYPLTENEILKFHPVPVFDRQHWFQELTELVNENIVYHHHNYFLMRDDIRLISRRTNGNQLAKQKLPAGRKFGQLISWFPFVRSVMISGSLSKDYMDKESDIDFFIITEPERLWLTKGLLAIFKRIFLFNSHRFFCANYLIDSRSLEIQEKNIYTAFETATLIPVYGEQLWNQFQRKNDWLKTYFPNRPDNETTFLPEKKNFVKWMLEKNLSGDVGRKLDIFFMRMTINRWKKKFGSSFNSFDFEIAFKSSRHVSKSHPNFFQKRVLTFFEEKVESFEGSHHVKLMP